MAFAGPMPVPDLDRIYSFGEQVETIHFHPNGVESSWGFETESGFQGLVKYYTESGDLSLEVTYDSGRVTGLTREYTNGTLTGMQYYKDGISDGLSRYYHPNGQLWSETELKAGKM